MDNFGALLDYLRLRLAALERLTLSMLSLHAWPFCIWEETSNGLGGGDSGGDPPKVDENEDDNDNKTHENQSQTQEGEYRMISASEVIKTSGSVSRSAATGTSGSFTPMSSFKLFSMYVPISVSSSCPSSSLDVCSGLR